MKIILAEENTGQTGEKSFDQPSVRIGRDMNECQIIFDNNLYPMVSRKHAELRFSDGKWTLFDLNSSYGTFLNGQKILAPQTVEIGSRLQFGVQGPVLRVVRFDVSAAPGKIASQPPGVSKPPPAAAPPNVPASVQTAPPTRQTPPQQTEMPRLEFVNAGGRPPVNFSKNNFWLGREPDCDIVFDPDAVMVSRKHAEIKRENGQFIVTDNGSFNGTLINDQRISAPTPIYHNDEIQLGMGGPVLRFNAPSRIAPKGADLAGQRGIAAGQMGDISGLAEPIGSKTMVASLGNISQKISEQTSKPQLLLSMVFGNKQELVIGRADSSDIKLDGLQISNRHARLLQTNSGIFIEDLGSTNGVYLNGNRVTRQKISPGDPLLIGTFLLTIDNTGNISVFDTRSKTRIDSVNITKDVKNRSGGGMLRLLDNISLSIKPNEFVGLLGPSGAGKSTFMDALNGMRPASGGSVLINNLDLYEHLDSLKQSIGYVPQDDIIHRELTVYRTLYYVAKLRLSRDVSRSEINKIIEEVLDVTGLTERRNVPINQLSGGQRKRVSIAVELITKPSVIYLDEPTSGLDPATEEKIMKLFRQIAESGRTVILTTHAMENVKLFDKIVLLMRGKLVFYGKPEECSETSRRIEFQRRLRQTRRPDRAKAQTKRQCRPAGDNRARRRRLETAF